MNIASHMRVFNSMTSGDVALPFPCAADEGARRTDGRAWVCTEERPHPPSAPFRAAQGKGKTAAFRELAHRFGALLFLLLFCLGAHAIDPLPFRDRAEEVRFQQLTNQLRCLVCQNQDLADSDADLAKDLRKQVFDLMRSGKSDDEIKQYLVARYNDFVLYDPPLKPGTWLLWFAPFALVLIGAIAVLRILRQRARQTLAASSAEARSSNAISAGEEDW